MARSVSETATHGVVVRLPVPQPQREAAGDKAARLLARPALHEIRAEEEGSAAASTFALLTATTGTAPVLWVRHDAACRAEGQVYAPGLIELGVDPARVVVVCARDVAGALKAAVDGLRCAGLGAVLVEVHGRAPVLDLTASRRMMLAAERSGVRAVLVRHDAGPQPSAAWTRWQVGSTPSCVLPANAPGPPAFTLELLRDRGGTPAFAARVEWSRDEARFDARDEKLSGGMAAVPAERTADPRRHVG